MNGEPLSLILMNALSEELTLNGDSHLSFSPTDIVDAHCLSSLVTPRTSTGVSRLSSPLTTVCRLPEPLDVNASFIPVEALSSSTEAGLGNSSHPMSRAPPPALMTLTLAPVTSYNFWQLSLSSGLAQNTSLPVSKTAKSNTDLSSQPTCVPSILLIFLKLNEAPLRTIFTLMCAFSTDIFSGWLTLIQA